MFIAIGGGFRSLINFAVVGVWSRWHSVRDSIAYFYRSVVGILLFDRECGRSPRVSI